MISGGRCVGKKIGNKKVPHIFPTAVVVQSRINAKLLPPSSSYTMSHVHKDDLWLSSTTSACACGYPFSINHAQPADETPTKC